MQGLKVFLLKGIHALSLLFRKEKIIFD